MLFPLLLLVLEAVQEVFQKRISDTSIKPYKLVKNVDGIIAGKAKSQRHVIESELQKF